MTRVGQARLLVRPVLRTVPVAAVLAGGGCGALVLSLDGDLLLRLRMAAVAVCVGAAFVLDDAAAVMTESSPTPLLFRRLLRVALLLPFVAGLWALLVAYAGAGVTAALTLELAAMLAATVAVAALAVPLVPDGRAGVAAVPTLLVLLATAALALPERWTLFAPGPDDPRWASSHERWGAVLVVALLALVYASLDPCRSPLRRRLVRRTREPIPLADTTEAA